MGLARGRVLVKSLGQLLSVLTATKDCIEKQQSMQAYGAELPSVHAFAALWPVFRSVMVARPASGLIRSCVACLRTYASMPEEVADALAAADGDLTQPHVLLK